jgi:hypothetical protein
MHSGANVERVLGWFGIGDVIMRVNYGFYCMIKNLNHVSAKSGTVLTEAGERAVLVRILTKDSHR